ncbi:MAG: phage minor capsid protein [Anaerobutyricum soehngenii]
MGAFDYGGVLRKTVTQLTNSGMRTIDYPSGWTNRVDVAARRASLNKEVAQVCGKINEYYAQQLGTEYFQKNGLASQEQDQPMQMWQGMKYMSGSFS